VFCFFHDNEGTLLVVPEDWPRNNKKFNIRPNETYAYGRNCAAAWVSARRGDPSAYESYWKHTCKGESPCVFPMSN
jgi:hypothetical protein